jgi:tetratricopeptide (TPR) repeat protein
MPSRRTEDVVHVVMTDHRIQRRKPAGDLLAHRREKTDAEQTYRGEVVLRYPQTGLDNRLRDIFLGIAQVKEKANLERGLPLLRKALSRREVPAAEPYFELAEAEAASGNKQAAVRAYRQAIERDPAALQPLNNLANLLADLGRPDEAIELYRKAIEIDPLASKTRTNLGLALLEKGDTQGAEQAFRDAVDANPMDSEAQLNLGSALLAGGDLQAARRALETALVIEPAKAKAHYNLGLLFLTLGQPADARAHFESAVKWGGAELQLAAAKYLNPEN